MHNNNILHNNNLLIINSTCPPDEINFRIKIVTKQPDQSYLFSKQEIIKAIENNDLELDTDEKQENE